MTKKKNTGHRDLGLIGSRKEIEILDTSTSKLLAEPIRTELIGSRMTMVHRLRTPMILVKLLRVTLARYLSLMSL